VCSSDLICQGTGHTLQGSAVISGCGNGIYKGTGHAVQGSAVISGCSNGICYGTGHTLQGSAVISGCSYGIAYGITIMRGGTLGVAADSKTCFDPQYGGKLICYGATLASTTQVTAATRLFRNTAPGPRVELWDPHGSHKYPKFWCGGGQGDTQASGPTSFDPTLTESILFTFEQDALTPTITTAQYAACFLDFPMWFPAGVKQTIMAYYKKTATGAYTSEPYIHIIDPDVADWPTVPVPLASTSAGTVASSDWQQFTLSYTEPTRSRMLLLRFTATNASSTCAFCHRVLSCYQFVNWSRGDL
jgi:hypothetical protein